MVMQNAILKGFLFYFYAMLVLICFDIDAGFFFSCDKNGMPKMQKIKTETFKFK